MCLKKLGNRRILAQRPDCQIADSRCEEITNYNYPFAFVKMAGRLSPPLALSLSKGGMPCVCVRSWFDKLTTNGGWLSANGGWLSANGGWLSANGGWLSANGGWLSANGGWLSASGGWVVSQLYDSQ